MKKNTIIAVIVLIVLVAVAYIIYMKLAPKPLIAKGEFGYETIANIKKDYQQLSCGDAKMLVGMINDIDMMNITLDTVTSEKMKVASGKIELAISNLGKALNEKFNADNASRDEALNNIGSSIDSIFEFFSYRNNGMLSEDRFNEEIEVVFCGAQPKYDAQFKDNESEGVEAEGIESSPESDTGGKTAPESADSSTENIKDVQMNDNKTK